MNTWQNDTRVTVLFWAVALSLLAVATINANAQTLLVDGKTLDETRLDVKMMQDSSYAKDGTYVQVGAFGADKQTAEAVAIQGYLNSDYVVNVYNAPCGRGWQIVYQEKVSAYATDTGKLLPEQDVIVHSAGSGCDAMLYTVNW